MANGVRVITDVPQVLILEDISSEAYIQFTALGTEDPTVTQYPCNFMLIANDTNYTMAISFDGVHPAFGALPNSTVTLEFSANKNVNGDALYLAAGTTFWGRALNAPETPAGVGIALSFFCANPSVR